MPASPAAPPRPPDAPPRPARRPAPGRRRWRRLVPAVGVLCLAAVILSALWFRTPLGDSDPIHRLARPHAFDLVAWEASQLGGRLPGLMHTLADPPPADSALATPDEVAAVRAFFAAVQRWRQAERSGASADDVAGARAEWQAARPAAEQAIARALDVLAVREGLTTSVGPARLLLPPPSFLVGNPPRVLVVSPRDRIEVVDSVLLDPDLSLADAEALEAEVEGRGLSGLVVTIGGIATYPAIVPLHDDPYETLSTIAHEWLHGYLIFRPLGRAYFSSYDARSLDETVAELGGRELGRTLARAYGYPARPTVPGAAAPSEAAPDAPAGFDFRREMRATRLHLDELLAAGQVDEAEQYLEARRQVFVAAGYPIRKLNQAYFAFYGSYGDTAASSNPLGGEIVSLRRLSPSLAAFVRSVQGIAQPADLRRLLRQVGGAQAGAP